MCCAAPLRYLWNLPLLCTVAASVLSSLIAGPSRATLLEFALPFSRTAFCTYLFLPCLHMLLQNLLFSDMAPFMPPQQHCASINSNGIKFLSIHPHFWFFGIFCSGPYRFVATNIWVHSQKRSAGSYSTTTALLCHWPSAWLYSIILISSCKLSTLLWLGFLFPLEKTAGQSASLEFIVTLSSNLPSIWDISYHLKHFKLPSEVPNASFSSWLGTTSWPSSSCHFISLHESILSYSSLGKGWSLNPQVTPAATCICFALIHPQQSTPWIPLFYH